MFTSKKIQSVPMLLAGLSMLAVHCPTSWGGDTARQSRVAVTQQATFELQVTGLGDNLALTVSPAMVEISDQPVEAEVKYWGNHNAITALRYAIIAFDPQAKEWTQLPLGIAPLSKGTMVSGSAFDAVAVFEQAGRSYILFADSNGPVGVRFSDYTIESSDIPNISDVFEDDSFALVTGCTATVPGESCSCSGKKCSAGTNSSTGVPFANCSGSGSATNCTGGGGSCSCNTVAQ